MQLKVNLQERFLISIQQI